VIFRPGSFPACPPPSPSCSAAERHRLKQLARSYTLVAGDVAPDIRGRDAGPLAERRDDRGVDVGLTDVTGAQREHEVSMFAGLAVQHRRLVGSDRLPGLDRLADERVDRFRERRAGLMGRDVEQADRVAGENLGGVAGDRYPVMLPADAADAEPRDLIAALPSEEPGQRDRAD